MKAGKYTKSDKKAQETLDWAMQTTQRAIDSRSSKSGTSPPSADEILTALTSTTFRKGTDWVAPLHEDLDVFLLYGEECNKKELLKHNTQLVARLEAAERAAKGDEGRRLEPLHGKRSSV